MHQLSQPNKGNSKILQHTIPRTHVPRYGLNNATHSSWSVRTIHRSGNQGSDSGKLFRHSKHSRSSCKTIQHADVTKWTASFIQLKIRGNPPSSIQSITKWAVQQDSHWRICKETATEHERKASTKDSKKELLHQVTRRCLQTSNRN